MGPHQKVITSTAFISIKSQLDPGLSGSHDWTDPALECIGIVCGYWCVYIEQ